ncbi:MAG: glycosyltransferase family 4 protein [Saprospiraceae bacterium]|nr:glycosyltransferase family 4 protein [Saprospiraceae bacterium]
MNVLHLMRWLLPFTASFIRNQIVHHQRYKPSLIYAQKKEGHFFNELSARFDTYHPIESRLEQQLYNKFRFFTPAVKKRVKAYIQNTQPDILHIHYGVDCLVYADIIKELNIPSCVSFYGYDCASFPKRFWGYGNTWLKKGVFYNPGVTAVLAMSEDMKMDLIQLGCPEEKIIVHYYGTETEPFFIERNYQEKDVVDLVIISSFTERKGHFFLLDAFEKLNKITKEKIHLHIVGDGYLKDAVIARVENTGLSNITIYPPVKYSSEEHINYLRMADIFVHPSIIPEDGQKEGIPGAIVEAMASGLPVMSTYHAGIPHIIENEKTGMLVKEYDVDGLANALKKLVENREFRIEIAKAGQKHAMNYLDIKEGEKELEEIYETLIHGRKFDKKTLINMQDSLQYH